MNTASCFTKNELASRGEPLAIFEQSEKKPHALRLTISKTCSFLVGRISLFFNTMLRKSLYENKDIQLHNSSCFTKNASGLASRGLSRQASGHFLTIKPSVKWSSSRRHDAFLAKKIFLSIKIMLRKSFHNYKDIQLYYSSYNIFKREFYGHC